MTNTLQNRLVGTIIVVALVIIFVPEFIDGEKQVNQQAFVDIPANSELVEVAPIERFDASKVENELNRSVEIVDESPVDVPDEVDAEVQANSLALEKQKTAASKESNNSSSDNSKAVEQVQSKAKQEKLTDKQDSGWVVQLGSFQHEKNVQELMKTLRDAGYRAYTRPITTNAGKLTKVFVGPELDRQKLVLALPKLQKITRLKGKITAFEVSAG